MTDYSFITFSDHEFELDVYIPTSANSHLHGHTSSRPSMDSSNLTTSGVPTSGFPTAEENAVVKNSSFKMWNPIWLSNAVLISFLLLYVVVFCVVLALYFYSEAHSGLLNASDGVHYLWTYLPTTIFVFTASLWHRVDFYCKELTPYHKMRQGSTPASQSILLDYITPMLPKTFWQALKYRHWAVVTSVTGLLMLKLCTILSAGLLFLSPIQIQQSTNSLVALSIFTAANLSTTEIAADPVDAFYGAKLRDLPWTYGTTENLTVQTFDFDKSDSLTSAVLAAEVPGFSVGMECEPVQISASNSPVVRPWIGPSVNTLFFVANISGPGCHILDVPIGTSGTLSSFIINKTSNYQGVFNYYVCNSNFNYEYLGEGGPLPNATSPDDYRFLLTMSELRWDLSGPSDFPTASNYTIARSTGVLCKPSYSFDMYNVALVPSNKTLHKAEVVPNTSTILTGFDIKDLLNGTVETLSVTTFGQGGDDYILTPVPPMFQLLAAMNNNSRQEAFIDPDLLRNLSTQALQGIGTQFGQRYLKQDQKQPLSGSVTSTQQRLLVKRLTFGLLTTALGLLAIIVLVLLRIRPWNSAPCETESIGSAAKLLAASQALTEHIQAQSSGLDNCFINLENFEYRTIVDSEGNFTIQPALKPGEKVLRSKETDKKEKISWWRPTATKKWFTACLIFVPLILMAALGVIQHVSDSNDGIAELSSSDDYHLAISYIPVLIMLLVATFFDSLDSTVSIFAPFIALRRGKASAERSISMSLVSKLPPHGFYLSLRNSHWAASFTICAALISGFLTIVSSGLYSPITVQSPHLIQVQQMDMLDLSHIDLSQGDHLAGTTTKLVMLNNLSFPTWTYDNLVFLSLAVQIPASLNFSSTTSEDISVSMKIPALRPSLNCTVASPSNTTQTGNFYSSGAETDTAPGVYSHTNANFPIADFSWSTASLGSKASNSTMQEGLPQWSHLFIMPNSTDTSMPNVELGFASPLQYGWNLNETDIALAETAEIIESYRNQGSYVVVGEVGLDVDPSAANFGFAAGFVSGNNTENVSSESLQLGNTLNASTWDLQTDLVVALCYQILEEVQAEVTFTYPNMSVSQNKPPIIDETTARIIMSNETTTPMWVINSAATTPTSTSPHWFGISLNNFVGALQDTYDTAQTLSAWFTALQNSYDGIPLPELLGRENQDKLLNASSRLYARYAVQAINSNMRITGAQDLPTYNATLSIPVLRLKQNKAPAIALQVLLGVMVVCGAIASYLLDTREVLMQSPTSIAGKMVLLTRSEMCNTREVIPVGAEWWDDRMRRENGLFNGWLFSLGWWDNGWYGINVGKAQGRSKVE